MSDATVVDLTFAVRNLENEFSSGQFSGGLEELESLKSSSRFHLSEMPFFHSLTWLAFDFRNVLL